VNKPTLGAMIAAAQNSVEYWKELSTLRSDWIDVLESRIARLREALEWYAEVGHHHCLPDKCSESCDENGERARAALGGK